MWATDIISNFQFFRPQNIHDFFITSRLQSSIRSIAFLSYPFLSILSETSQSKPNQQHRPNNHESHSHACFLDGAPGIGRIGHDVSSPRYVEDFLPQWRIYCDVQFDCILAKVSTSRSTNNITPIIRWIQHSSGEQHHRQKSSQIWGVSNISAGQDNPQNSHSEDASRCRIQVRYERRCNIHC